MAEPEDRLIEMAGDVSDEITVDWESATRDPENDGVPIRGLELISRVAAAHWDNLASEAPVETLFTWGPLQVIDELGRGSYGVVYRAWDPNLQTEVALKLRTEDEGSTRLWLEEARRLARVRHPNVVRVLGADLHDGRAGIWMELLDGPTLAERLAPDQVLSPRETILTGLDLCAALAAVHGSDLVHGDVKPQNVAQVADGRCVLLDFGSGRELGSSATRVTMTPVFTAPEVLEGQPTTVASDIYGLGALLFRGVSGTTPVEADSWDELRAAHRNGTVASLRSVRPDLSTDLVAAIDTALRPDPSERHADMAAFERALRAAMDRPRSVARWFAPLAAVLAVAVLGWGIATRPWETSPPPFSASGPSQSTIRAIANFYRVDGGSREPLGAGSVIKPGEQLRLELTGDRDLFVYVLNEDSTGELFLLFPVEGIDLQNPLAADELHRMPGPVDGQSHDWLVTSAGGRERFLVVAASEPLGEFEHLLAAVRPAATEREVQYPALSEEDFAILRGVGGMVRGGGEAGEWGGSRLTELASLLEQSPLPHGALWYRQVEFLNPRP